jgi:hypothetical protein
MIANLSKLLLFPFSKRVMIIPEDFTKADLSNIDVFYINWGSNITPRLEDLKKSLENDKNSRVIEL